MPVMFDIGILIQHPTMDPEKITDELGAKPTSMFRRNDLVITPTGRETGDRYKWTSWSYFGEDDSLSPNEKIDFLLKKIVRSSAFVSAIAKGGGKVTLVIRHDGDGYDHCEVRPETVSLLASLSITIGFEVFAE
jgi:Domain of unknown function (DUF4279)